MSVAGGMKVSEPAADLAVVLAIASSLKNRPLDAQLVAFGEVGLSGEVRPVPQVQRRLAEAYRLGLSRAIVPQSGMDGVTPPEGMTVFAVRTLRQALHEALGVGNGRSEHVPDDTKLQEPRAT